MPCFYCGVKFRKRGIFLRTKDHVIPKSKGGTKIVYACLKCNQAKASMSLEEFRILRGGVEFYGERVARQEREKTDWIWSFSHEDADPVQVPLVTKRKIVAELGSRPAHTPTVDLSKIIRYPWIAKKKKKERPASMLPPDLPDLREQQFGALRVTGWLRKQGRWEVLCMCGAKEVRTTRAVRNPANTFDACVECRKPVGKLRSDIYKETGVDVTWEDCFQHIYGCFLEKRKEELCPTNGTPVGIAVANSFSTSETIQGSEPSTM